ncbi:DUF1758 domain-containing protein [Trichonephila clavipes]|nr:DUF1758 domain-containing protein [Trichonephila clavipes]
MENTKIYQQKRVKFGITISFFLLEVTLEYHLKQNTGYLQFTAKMLLVFSYVDNHVTSTDHSEDKERFRLESRKILSLIKFNLREWEHTSDSIKKTIGGNEESSSFGFNLEAGQIHAICSLGTKIEIQ